MWWRRMGVIALSLGPPPDTVVLSCVVGCNGGTEGVTRLQVLLARWWIQLGQ